MNDTVMVSTPAPDARRFDRTITVVYALVIAVLNYRHEFWSDEAQQWLIARASHGIGDLHRRLAYEGHPLPWYLILYPFAHLSDNIAWIKLIDLPVSIAVCALTCRYYLRSGFEKILFLLAPMPAFYFSVLVRPYMLGTLLIVLTCLALRRPERSTRIFLPIAVLASLHLYFLIIGGAFLVYYGLLIAPSSLRRLPLRFWIGLTATLAVFAATALQCLPPADSGYKTIYMAGSYSRAVGVFGLAMGPFVWVQTSMAAFAIVTLPYYALVYYLARADWKIAVFAVTGTVLLCLFEGFVYGGSEWHAGVVYTGLLAAVFLARNSPELAKSIPLNQAFAATLVIHAACGLLILHVMMSKPYSSSQAVAAYIHSVCAQPCSLLSETSQMGVPVSAYLGGAPVFYASHGTTGTYTIMNDREAPAALQTMATEARSMPAPILLRQTEADPASMRENGLVLLSSFTDAVPAGGSAYYLYGLEDDLPAGARQ